MGATIKTLFLASMLFVSVVQAASECASLEQMNGAVFDSSGMLTDNSGFDKLWECPSLQNVNMDADGNYPYTHKLQDVDFAKGIYKCSYFYKNSGQYKQSCTFHSKLYEGIKTKVETRLNGTVKPDGTSVEGLITKEAPINLNDILLPPVSIPAPMQNAMNVFNNVRTLLINIQNDDPSVTAEGSQARRISDDLQRIQRLAYEQLVKVWEDGYSTVGVRKGHTLSNFIAGVITLDPDIVKGYDPNSGKLMIQPEWKTATSSISGIENNIDTTGETGWTEKVSHWISSAWNWVTDAVTDDKPDSDIEKALYSAGVQYKIYSYTKIFEDKLWGFYYMLQERLDIGYTFLASSLLFLMSGWLFATVGVAEGVKYFSDQDKYKMEVREGAYIKTMIVAGTLSLFFLSIPSGMNDAESEDGTYTQNQMHKNYTVAKKFIRISAQTGANIATMFNDLGLSAYTQFITKKELIMSVGEIRRTLETSLSDIYMYAPAISLKNECHRNYNTVSDVDFINSLNALDYPENITWKDTPYAVSRNISSIDFSVCQKAYRIYALAPYQIAQAAGEANFNIEHMSDKLSEATYYLNYNNIALNEKLGWVGGFSTVLSYFILKNNDMFLSKGVDENKINEYAERITETTTHDIDSLKRASFTGKMQDKVAYGAAWTIDFLNGLYVYNILPMFSDIQTSIYKYMSNIYDSKLKIRLAEMERESNDDDASGLLKSMISKVKTSFISPIGRFLDAVTPDTLSSTLWYTTIMLVSYFLAIVVWKAVFSTIFTILVSLLFVIAFVMYFFDLIVHFVTSLFMFVWAFTKHAAGQGDGKIKEWFKNTIVIVVMKPTVLVFGLYIFIFAYEMLTQLYMYIFKSATTSLMGSISLMGAANSATGVFDNIGAYTTVMSMQTIAEVTIDLFSLYIAYVSIIKMPSIIYKKLGVDSDDAASHHQVTESVTQRAEKHNNPIQ